MSRIHALVMPLAMSVVLLTEAAAETGVCLPSTAPVRGELRMIKTRHPNGQSIDAMQLVFRPPICVVIPTLGEEGRLLRLDVREMHIVPQKQYVTRLRRALGQAVTARGEISEPLTASHRGDAIMFDAVVLHIETR